MQDHPYGWISLMPPIVAIVLALVTRRAVPSLLMGIFCGAMITNSGDPVGAVIDFCEIHLWPTLADPGKLRIFSFTILMGAMIGVISRSGGMLGLIHLVSPIAKTRRGGQLTTWMLGLVVFFDDYANTMLLGGTLRPLCDRLKISREKLAYIVDSTAAPVASLTLLSTWVAIEVDYIAEGLEGVEGASVTRAMELFIASIPYRFYAILALLMVPTLALMGRDFGPMRRAEQARQGETEVAQDDGIAVADPLTDPARSASFWVAAVPIVATIVVVMILLYLTGSAALQDDAAEPAKLRDILGAADSSLALQYGALTGLTTVTLMCLIGKLLTLQQIKEASLGGIKVVFPAIVILWTASALSRLTGGKSVEGQTSQAYEFSDHRLYTGQYVADAILASAKSPVTVQPERTPAEAPAAETGNTAVNNTEASTSRTGDATSAEEQRIDGGEAESVPIVLRLLPTIIFLLAAALSFSTGTSFGTMGLLMPMSLTLAAPLVASMPGGFSGEEVLVHPLMLATIASVLSGAVFGDHCSPISDTTILSSQACGCDHIAHVLTQMPYAVTAGLIAIVLGTIPIGWGVGWGWLFLLQLAVLVAVIRLAGKPLDGDAVKHD